MSKIQLLQASSADQNVDAIVNAANCHLFTGGGICGVIFDKAGLSQLSEACRKFMTPLKDGSAVITPAFNIKNAKAIIHAVGPDFARTPKAFEELFNAYYNSLIVLKENGYHSISFPLISSGIFGGSLSNPVAESTKQCMRAYDKFVSDYPDYEIDVKLCAYKDTEMEKASLEFEQRTRKEKTDESSETKSIRGFQILRINGKQEKALFFHKPEEPHGWLSNWYKSDFTLEGMKYSSVEQYIMHKKCVLFGDMIAAKRIMDTDDPAKHQFIAKNATGFIDSIWIGCRQVLAEKALYAKFSQDAILKEKLLSTQDVWLVECARSDKNWACGIGLDDPQRMDASLWKGTNILGFALMKVREDLRKGA